jgi:hypothetical protein
MLWYWMMGPHPKAALGFLHAFFTRRFTPRDSRIKRANANLQSSIASMR